MLVFLNFLLVILNNLLVFLNSSLISSNYLVNYRLLYLSSTYLFVAATCLRVGQGRICGI